MLACRDARELLDQHSWRIPFAVWAFGYMTGLNAVLTQTERRHRDLSGLNVDLVVGSLKVACDAEPEGIVLQGADRLWGAFGAGVESAAAAPRWLFASPRLTLPRPM